MLVILRILLRLFEAVRMFQSERWEIGDEKPLFGLLFTALDLCPQAEEKGPEHLSVLQRGSWSESLSKHGDLLLSSSSYTARSTREVKCNIAESLLITTCTVKTISSTKRRPRCYFPTLARQRGWKQYQIRHTVNHKDMPLSPESKFPLSHLSMKQNKKFIKDYSNLNGWIYLSSRCRKRERSTNTPIAQHQGNQTFSSPKEERKSSPMEKGHAC